MSETTTRVGQMRSPITKRSTGADTARAGGVRTSKSKADKGVKLRVKKEPPTLEEAMIAAACISDDPAQQIEIAASLMGLPLDASTTKALSAAKPRGSVVDVSTRGGASRTVVVEKKRTIRPPVRTTTVTPRAFSGQLRLSRI
jgi:hypothetical protein